MAASVASVVGVGALLLGAKGQGNLKVGLGVAAIATSWVLIPTIFAVHYADLFYSGRGTDEIDCGGDSTNPDYRDFAYLAFTLAMTFQVSDTALHSQVARRLALLQALLSFFFGAIILASTVNLVSSLAS